MSRLTRDGTAEHISRDQIFRHVRGQGNIHFPCSADHERDSQPYQVDPYPCYMCVWPYTIMSAPVLLSRNSPFHDFKSKHVKTTNQNDPLWRCCESLHLNPRRTAEVNTTSKVVAKTFKQPLNYNNVTRSFAEGTITHPSTVGSPDETKLQQHTKAPEKKGVEMDLSLRFQSSRSEPSFGSGSVNRLGMQQLPAHVFALLKDGTRFSRDSLSQRI